MAKDMDVYQPCVCGSGKKLKFCCLPIVEELQNFFRSLQEGQLPAAQMQLAAAAKKVQPRSTSQIYVTSLQAFVSLLTNDHENSRKLAEEVLELQPDNSIANALLGEFALMSGNLNEARRRVELGQSRMESLSYRIINQLLLRLADIAANEQQWLSAFQLLGSAAAYESGTNRSRESGPGIAQRGLVELIQDETISSLYASIPVIRLEAVGGTEAQRAKAEQAAAAMFFTPIRSLGMWTALAKELPESAEVLRQLGFSQALNWQAEQAVKTLRESARRDSDFEVAVETEALAQQIELDVLLPVAQMKSYRYEVTGISQLLTLLDAQPLFRRQAVAQVDADERSPVGAYVRRDRAAPAVEALSPTTIPCFIANLTIYDATEENKTGELFWVSYDDEPAADEARIEFEKLGGEHLKVVGEPRQIPSHPQEYHSLLPQWDLEAEIPYPQLRQLLKQRAQLVVQERWPSRPLTALGGKSPLEAKGHPELRIPLAAAILILVGLGEEQKIVVEEDQLRMKFDLPAVESVVVEEELKQPRLTIPQIRRLNWQQLSDEQVSACMDVAQMSHHRQVLYSAFQELLSRPTLSEDGSESRVCAALVELCHERFHTAEGLAWVARGRKAKFKTDSEAFMAAVRWDLLELKLRASDPADSQSQVLASRLWRNVSTKMPELAAAVAEQLSILLPGTRWDVPTLVTSDSLEPAGSVSGSGLWTPDSPTESTGGKLWVPGS